MTAALFRVDAVSPELALVDPGLGQQERTHLPDPPDTLARIETLTWRPRAAPPTLLGTCASALPTLAIKTLPQPSARYPRALARVAAVAAAVTLLLHALSGAGEDERGRIRAGVDTRAGSLPAPPASSSTARNSARPSSPPATPGVLPSRRAAQRFAWAPAANADGYVVELFQGETRVFSALTRRAELALPPTWQHDGQVRRLQPGEYRWYVWPRRGGRTTNRAIVQATLVVPVP